MTLGLGSRSRWRTTTWRKGQPPGHWAGKGAAGLGVTGTVTEAQMKNLFGEGRHPDADTLAADLVAAGATR